MSPLIIDATVLLLTVLYALLTDNAARRYLAGKSRFDALARPLLIGTVSLHLFALLLRGFETRTCPVLTRWEALSFVAFAMTAIYLALEVRRKIRVTAVFVLGFAAAMQFLSAIFILGGGPAEPTGSPDLASSFHAFAAMIGLSGVAVAGIFGLLYVRLHQKIRRSKFGPFYQRMPSLEELGDLNASAAALGFLALSVTVGIGLSSMFTHGDEPRAVELPWFPIALTMALWLLLGVCSLGHRFGKLGGARLAWATVVAFAAACGLLVSLGPQGVHGT